MSNKWLLASAFVITFISVASCSDDKKGGEKQSYSFSTSTKRTLKSGTLATEAAFAFLPNPSAGTLPPSCVDNICFTPTALTGKYYGVGLMIQSGGSGMNAYFGQDNWSSINSTSPMYDFDFKTPLTQSGNLICCTGQGDLSSENTYFSDVIYLFGYIDVTFDIPASSGARGDALGTHSIRIVLAKDAVAGASRGDLLYKSADKYQWMDSQGLLSDTRPSSPVTMNASVVSWTNPFGDKGNTEIPVIGVQLNEPAGGGVNQTTESALKAADKTYTFDFDSTGFVFLPRHLKADGGMLNSKLDVMKAFHIQGLPHSGYGDGQPGPAGKTTLKVE